MTSKLFIPRKNYLVGADGKEVPHTAYEDELANYLAIETWANNIQSGAYPPFDFPGPLVVSASDLFCPVVDTTITQTVWTLASTSTGGASVVVGLYKNNVSVDTVTIASGVQVFPFTLTTPITLSGGKDYLSAKITSAGTAAAGLLGAIG